MITTDNILNIHSKHNNLAAAGADPVTERGMHELLMYALDSNHLELDGDRIVLAKGEGPLKEIEIERICGFEDLGSHVAIVLPASVLLVGKKNGRVSVYLPD